MIAVAAPSGVHAGQGLERLLASGVRRRRSAPIGRQQVLDRRASARTTGRGGTGNCHPSVPQWTPKGSRERIIVRNGRLSPVNNGGSAMQAILGGHRAD